MEPSSITSAARAKRLARACQNGRFVDQTWGDEKPLVVLKDGKMGRKLPCEPKNMVLGKLIIYLTLLGFDLPFQGHFPHGWAVFVCFFREDVTKPPRFPEDGS